MQNSDVKMFAEEILRLEAEAEEAQQVILTQTERLRNLEQRIAALKSVVSGTQTRLSMSAPEGVAPRPVLSQNDGFSTGPGDVVPIERSTISTSLFGLQRAYASDSVDIGTYRAIAPHAALRNSAANPAASAEETASPPKADSRSQSPGVRPVLRDSDSSGKVDTRL